MAGVSRGAASFALNGRPGVSEATRQRVLASAAQLGWTPNTAAKALSASRSDAIGLVIARPTKQLAREPFYMEFVAGVETVLAETSTALLLKVVPDATVAAGIYRSWWMSRRVDGVIVTDLGDGDPRPEVLRELGLPAVAVYNTSTVVGAPWLPTVWDDAAAGMRLCVEHLTGLGHRLIARVSGPAQLAHSQARTCALLEAAESAGVDRPVIVEADFSGPTGAQAVLALLDRDPRPTAVIFDNDVMAVASLSALRAVGLVVPDDLSVVAFDDSPLCEVTAPQITALERDIPGLGVAAARSLLQLVQTDRTESRELPVHQLMRRASTAPPPARA